MNLGLGLIAADNYFKEGDARKTREYVQAKRDAELSTLGQETENKKARLGLESTNVKAETGRAGAVNQTKDIQANMVLSDAQNAQTNQPLKQEIESNKLKGAALTSSAELAQLPDRLEMAATQGAIDHQGQSDVVLGTMGQLISRQDKAGAIDFANRIAKKGNLMPNTNGKTFTDIQEVRGGPEGDGYNFVTADGESRFVPANAIGGAMQKLKSGKYHFLHTTDGSVYAGNENTGSVQQVHKGDPKLLRGQHTPAEVQTMQWLIDNKVAKDPTAAWEQVRSAREKTRNAFIMDYVSKNALPGADTNKMANDAGNIYDTLRQNQGPTNPAQSNNPGQGTLGSGSYDPRINSLIGVPSQ